MTPPFLLQPEAPGNSSPRVAIECVYATEGEVASLDLGAICKRNQVRVEVLKSSDNESIKEVVIRFGFCSWGYFSSILPRQMNFNREHLMNFFLDKLQSWNLLSYLTFFSMSDLSFKNFGIFCQSLFNPGLRVTFVPSC